MGFLPSCLAYVLEGHFSSLIIRRSGRPLSSDKRVMVSLAVVLTSRLDPCKNGLAHMCKYLSSGI